MSSCSVSARLICSFAVLAVFTATVITVLPASMAASFKYARNVATKSGSPKYSGYRASINGGKAVVRAGAGDITIVTYHPAPGYREVARVSTSMPYVANLSHARERQAHSKCFWRWGNLEGKLRMECWVRW